jgi:ATP-dependent Clp protease adaptor protein ClpS
MGRNVTRQDPESSNLKNPTEKEERFLILHNDSVNTFDHVIKSLIDVCMHDPIQAEQCTFITHYKGKCDVRKGEYESLKPLREGLMQRGLQVTID